MNNIDEIEQYNGADGIYEVKLDDGGFICIEIETTDNVNNEAGINPIATEYIQNKSYKYSLYKSNGNLDWSSEVVGTFHFNYTYVWCTAGIAYVDYGDSGNSSISYSKNTYSSAQVTDVSKYEIEAKIVTPTGTYNISQYVGSAPDGEISYDTEQ